MKKLFLLAALIVTLGQFQAVAHAGDATHPAAGTPIYSADGRSLGTIYKVLPDGSIRLIVEGKMVAIPGADLYEDHGTLTTTLTRTEVRELH